MTGNRSTSAWGTSSRFGVFVVWSLAVHAGLALLIAVPAGSAHQQRKEEQEAEETRQQAEQKREKEKVLDRAQEEIKTQLKKELAAEQLQTTFDELTRDLLEPEERQVYWDVLQGDLDLELGELADLLQAEPFDLGQVEGLLQQIKEKMLARLTDRIEQDQQKRLAEQVRAVAEQTARQLAELLGKNLKELVGQPAGDQLAGLLQKEEQEVVQALKQAEQKLAAAKNELAQAAQAVPRGEAGQQAMPGRPGQDQSAAQVRREKAGLDAAGKNLARARKDLTATADNLADRFPGLAEQIKKIEGQVANRADAPLRAASQAAAKALGGEAAGKDSGGLRPRLAREDSGGLRPRLAREAQQEIHKAMAAVDRVRAAVQVRRALEETNTVARSVASQERNARQLARDMESAEKAADPARLALTARDVAAAEKKAGTVEAKAKQLGSLAQTLADRETGRQGDKETKGTSSLPLAAQKAQEAIKKGRDALSGEKPAQAAEKFQQAQARLEEVQCQLRADQERLGVKDASTAEALLRQLETLRQGNLAQLVQQRFGQALESKTPHSLQAQLMKTLEQNGKEQPGATRELREQTEKELNRQLAQQLRQRVNPRDASTRGPGSVCPRPGIAKTPGAYAPGSPGNCRIRPGSGSVRWSGRPRRQSARPSSATCKRPWTWPASRRIPALCPRQTPPGIGSAVC